MTTRAPRTITVREVAEVLGISRNHAFRCVQRGEIPSFRVGRRLLVPTAFLDALLESGSPSSVSSRDAAKVR